MPEFIRSEVRDRVAYITIDCTEVLNAMNPPALQELDDIWEECATNDDIWIAVLTEGRRRAFCTGNDLKWVAEGPPGRARGQRDGDAGTRGDAPGGGPSQFRMGDKARTERDALEGPRAFAEKRVPGWEGRQQPGM